MKFTAEIDIMPHKELLDPQGKAVQHSMGNLQISGVNDVRIGKHIRMDIEAASKEEATAKVDEACKKLLANLIMETYHFTLNEN
ncbi:MAG: phosphoribosylformylglycinamidine synthase subunit PurS [Saprospiraceae bacterium]|jgi:phosphoribosylformylglycinamidine synthase|nr:phosphoribosylformylglycinamidine synthase subunit PurS [Saprospiraceae bacterium]